MTFAIAFLLIQSIQRAQASGRVLLTSDTRIEAPAVPIGRPPVLTFRYLEGAKRHGFGNLDLVIDDAGH